VFFCLVFAYRLLGAGWLIMNTEGALHVRVVERVKASLWFTAAGVLAISVVIPLVSQCIFDKWFSFPDLLMLLPTSAMTLAFFVVIRRSLPKLPSRFAQDNRYGAEVP
jgi:cytochrome d ubiquinol oxidase subunit II